MDLYNLVIAAKLQKGGGGGDIEVDALNVTENGVYSASSGHAFDPVTVSVPQSGITPTGTKDINANGIYDVTSFASASVSVPVGVFPSGTSQITSNGIYDVTNFVSASVAVPGASGTSVITSNGIYDIASFASASVNVPGIVPSGTSSITANGIYDITNFASVDVNVSGGGGGGYTADDIAERAISGAISGSATSIFAYAFQSCSALTTASFPNVMIIGSCAFSSCIALTTASFPNAMSIGSYAFYGCTSLTTAVFLASSVVSLAKTNAFAYTPMQNSAYTGSFGSIYVPASLVSNYKTAYVWSDYAGRITAYEG